MLAMGSLLVGVGILLAGLLAVFVRHPRAPRWSKPEIVAMLAVVPVTVVLGVGCGYVLVGVYQLLHGAGELYELAALLGVALVVAGSVSWVRRRLQAYSTASAPAGSRVDPAATPTPMIDGPPGPTSEAA
jgi:branched-subunit amino acid ABC-type transport system permease component